MTNNNTAQQEELEGLLEELYTKDGGAEYSSMCPDEVDRIWQWHIDQQNKLIEEIEKEMGNLITDFEDLDVKGFSSLICYFLRNQKNS